MHATGFEFSFEKETCSPHAHLLTDTQFVNTIYFQVSYDTNALMIVIIP